MSILNNRITKYIYLKLSKLVNLIDDLYYENETVFLSIKFYNDFKDNFNVSYNKFIEYIENNELYTSYDIVYEFFYYKNDYDNYIIKNKDKH